MKHWEILHKQLGLTVIVWVESKQLYRDINTLLYGLNLSSYIGIQDGEQALLFYLNVMHILTPKFEEDMKFKRWLNVKQFLELFQVSGIWYWLVR
jgi:hypothetical protein